jgi:glucan phosphoethanolaminetransferase (alkaline phosphatase superfamily)
MWKKLFRLSALLFDLLLTLNFFVFGLFFAKWIEAGKNQGLAGGAIVMGYGVLFAAIALVIAIMVGYWLTTKTLGYLNIISALVFFTFIGFFSLRNPNNNTPAIETEESREPTVPTQSSSINFLAI